MSDLISRQAAIEAVHKSIFDFFDICDDDEESPMTYKDELLLKLNKAITTQIKAVASAPTIDIDTITKAHSDKGYEQGCRDGYAEAESYIEFCEWIADTVLYEDFEDKWTLGAFAEVACRKLHKLCFVHKDGGYWTKDNTPTEKVDTPTENTNRPTDEVEE